MGTGYCDSALVCGFGQRRIPPCGADDAGSGESSLSVSVSVRVPGATSHKCSGEYSLLSLSNSHKNSSASVVSSLSTVSRYGTVFFVSMVIEAVTRSVLGSTGTGTVDMSHPCVSNWAGVGCTGTAGNRHSLPATSSVPSPSDEWSSVT